MENQGENVQFLETHNLLKLNQEAAESLNRTVTIVKWKQEAKTPGTQKPWTRSLHR